MAASGARKSEDSSSSEDEQLRRCQEAVWDSPAVKRQDASSTKKPSKRLAVADHNHDGNELQVTQGFQIHVAQKLGAMLDSFISEKQSTARPTVNAEAQTTGNNHDEDEGFRLFSTSIPGQKVEEPPPRRRPIPSSSDSDSEMEMRLKEAAISIKDLFPPSTSELPTNLATPETPSLETKTIKKKKKRKPNPEENGTPATKSPSDNPSKLSARDDEAQTTVKRKKKKKKRSTLENPNDRKK